MGDGVMRDRRSFLGAGAAMVGAGAVGAVGVAPRRVWARGAARGAAWVGGGAWGALGVAPRCVGARGAGRGPVSIASGNGLAATSRALAMLREGADPLDAIVDGVRIIEDDPEDMTVGLGGLPNEEGVVELDASVMHGPTHRAGAVASMRNIRNPAAVAREVARRTDHVLIVGEGARLFAQRMGFREENLLTEKARREWLRWRANLSREDKWLHEDELDLPTPEGDRAALRGPALRVTGTVHVSALSAGGALAGCTSTSGLAWKLPGRVGDSPIIGAGLYTDNDVGSAGATGRGEAVMQVCGARHVVARMEAGDHPTDACMHALRLIARTTTAKRLLDERGRPNFNVVFYALRKDGAYGSACMHEGRDFAVSDDRGDRREACAFAYPA